MVFSQVRGDIARAVFYMAVRYGIEQPTGNLNLQLSDSPSVGMRPFSVACFFILVTYAYFATWECYNFSVIENVGTPEGFLFLIIRAYTKIFLEKGFVQHQNPK